MKSYRQELWFNLPERMEFRNITPEIEVCLRDSEILEGLCLIKATHAALRAAAIFPAVQV
jgi:thiamine phosphate synthase YjbQ (UPF0047 family)